MVNSRIRCVTGTKQMHLILTWHLPTVYILTELQSSYFNGVLMLTKQTFNENGCALDTVVIFKLVEKGIWNGYIHNYHSRNFVNGTHSTRYYCVFVLLLLLVVFKALVEKVHGKKPFIYMFSYPIFNTRI